ncbi:MAG: GAF domain-containing protein [Cytophagales bacterium]|nr:GAF domain-containing protein [Cytophagales bacterium]
MVLFFLVVSADIGVLIFLPDDIAAKLLGDIHRVGEVYQVLTPLYAVQFLALFLSVFAVLYFAFWKSAQTADKVVYVDRLVSDKEDDVRQVEDDEESALAKLVDSWEEIAADGAPASDCLKAVCSALEAGQGMLYARRDEASLSSFRMIASYAYTSVEGKEVGFELGETLAGQAAENKKAMVLNHVPENHEAIRSGLGEALPRAIAIFPVLDENSEVIGVLEVGAFKAFSPQVVREIEKRAGKFREFCLQSAEKE